ncbi:TonB-dependent receptor [Brevundimonas sp. CEF1]|uniref:TonB-dependent receptor n=1 Tax=Brevundimonas sp. CEF1 TaxID=3442642 RepID=UPI003F50D5C6
MTKMEFRRRAMLAAGVAAAALAVPGLTWAQDATAQGATSLDDVIVTAQRREQSLQEVPITVNVISAKTLEALAADDMGDMAAFVPGLSVSNTSPTQARYSIRGVATSDFGVGTDPAVGVYVDGVYAARSGAALLAFSDVARVEVLKGPQGTLFGRNSAAGAVSITTNKPSDDFEAKLGLRLGEYDKQRLEGLINVPINDVLALRVNALSNRRDGWLIDSATGEDYDRENNWAARAALRWDVTPRTQAILSWSHDEIDQDARPAIGVAPIPATPGLPAFPPDPADYTNPFDQHVLNDVIDNHETRRLDEGVLTITHAFGDIDFTSLTSVRRFTTENREDEDGTNRPDLYFDTNNREKNRSWYQEFRLAGESGAFNWIAGASYYSEHAEQRSDTYATTDTINTILTNAAGAPLFSLADMILGMAGIPASTLGHSWQEDMINEGDFDATAVFADVIWTATDRLNLTFGLRYTHDKKSFQWLNGRRVAPELDAVLNDPTINFVLSDNMGPALGYLHADYVFDLSALAGVPCENGVTVQEGVTCKLSDSWSDVSPRFVADYHLTDSAMVFFSYAKGYKAGGFNSVEVASRFDNEDVQNFEIGLKSDLGAKARLNISAFQYDYDGKQSIRLVVPTGSSVPQYLVETSDDTAWGVDMQLDVEPLDGLNLFANAQYIDATYNRKMTDDGDLAGQPTGEPLWSASAGASYRHDLGAAGSLDMQVIHAYRGEGRCNTTSTGQGSCLQTPWFDPSEAQNRTDVRLYWRNANARYQVGVYVNNLFDNQYVTGVNNITATTLGTPFVGLTEPRMWGVDLTYTY